MPHGASWIVRLIMAFPHEEALALLGGVTDGSLWPAGAIMDQALVQSRSDGVVIGRAKEPHGLSELALSVRCPGSGVWQVLPWISQSGRLALVQAKGGGEGLIYKLPMPGVRSGSGSWKTEEERQAGLARGETAFARSGEASQ